jgi:branched-chain amino acid transport system permease protein
LPVVALILVALAIPFAVSGFQTLVFAYALIFGIAILGLNVLTGFSGQISLGHGAFMAIGAFTTAIGIRSLHMPYALTIPLSALVCWGLGYVIGLAGSRLAGIYLGLATFALAVATPDLLKKQTSLTGGVKGVSLPPVVSPTGLLGDDQFFYLLCLGIALVLFICLEHLGDRAWRAVRDGELAAAAFGVNVNTTRPWRLRSARRTRDRPGSLYGLATGFVSTDAFPFQLSIALLVGAVVGGIDIGDAIVAVCCSVCRFFSAIPVAVSALANAAPGAVQGVLLLIVLGLARGGVRPGDAYRVWSAAREWYRPASDEATS